MSKRIVSVAVAVLLTLGLAGCGGGTTDTDQGTLSVNVVTLPDGSKVVCVHKFSPYSGISCDWEGRR